MKQQRTTLFVAALAVVAATLTGCGGADTTLAGSASETVLAAAATSDSDLGAVGTLDSAVAHTIDMSFDESAYAAMIEAYRSTGEKTWLEATVTIDGTTYEAAGIRLKGNSSLFNLSASAEADTLPWLIKLDKYVDGQNHEGLTDLVVRSNNSTTALNEAVALELLELAGLASQDAIAVAFSIGGEEPVLRLVIEHPDDIWMDEEFSDDGALYKAESTGDYTYRGDDPEAYDEVFDQEAGKDNADLTPLIDFLEFINNSDDATFVSDLDQWLDVDAFATYLAMQNLIDNFDDIDGPGNNSYLYYDTATGEFTVVAWDHNLAFGLTNGPGDAPGQPGDITAIQPGEPPVPGDPGAAPPGRAGGPGQPGADVDDIGGVGGPGGLGPNGSNVLAERFLANDTWAALVETRLEELRAELFTSGIAEQILSEWTDIVAGTDLVDTVTIEADATQIRSILAS